MATIDLILWGVSLDAASDVAEVSENLLPHLGHRYCPTPSFRIPSCQSGTRQSGHLRSLLAFRERAAFSRLSFSPSSISESDSNSASVSADASSLVSIKKTPSGDLGGVRGKEFIAKQTDPGRLPNPSICLAMGLQHGGVLTFHLLLYTSFIDCLFQ
jgi:hypothetical protein